jgi:hypothetical protein
VARTRGSGSSRRPSFETDLRRRTGIREVRERLLVVCGSAATESDYLRGLTTAVANPAVTVKLSSKPGSATQVVKYAVGQRDRARGEFDEVWCVLDVDEYKDVPQAVKDAKDAGIELAVSNPCFELWLILHFARHTAYAGTYRELRPALARHLPDYDKSRLDFRKFESGWQTAVDRARGLAPQGEEHRTNPATGAWALACRIAGHAPLDA